ncbi:hypothetical protein BHT94_04820 [Bacillus licheniformis]|nr:hypothetical protein BHT94_04820 [Bacillus licheniformis]
MIENKTPELNGRFDVFFLALEAPMLLMENRLYLNDSTTSFVLENISDVLAISFRWSRYLFS